MPPSDRVLLVDNGSLEPESTLQLRQLARALSERTGVRVEPTSLAHSGKIPAEKLAGTPAELFEVALDRVLAEGAKSVIVIPLFLGPSHAVVRVLPAIVDERKKRDPVVRVGIAPALFANGDERLAEILTDHVRELAAGLRGRPRVAIVDHGSPNAAVTEVRNEIAAQVRRRLANDVIDVQPCSMERREGAEYDFNDPLLAKLLEREEWSAGPTIIGMLFLAPGRHAGPDGDVAQICRGAVRDASAVRMTKLIGQHPRLLDILEDRVRSAAEKFSGSSSA